MQGRKLSYITAVGGFRPTAPVITKLPTPPEWMRPRAAARFRDIIGQLTSVGSLAVTDIGVVERYACIWDRWCSAEETLALGSIHYGCIKNRAGEEASSVATASMAQASKCHDQLLKLEAVLGLNPVERARLPMKGTTGPPDKMEQLLAEHFGH